MFQKVRRCKFLQKNFFYLSDFFPHYLHINIYIVNLINKNYVILLYLLILD